MCVRHIVFVCVCVSQWVCVCELVRARVRACVLSDPLQLRVKFRSRMWSIVVVSVTFCFWLDAQAGSSVTIIEQGG